MNIIEICQNYLSDIEFEMEDKNEHIAALEFKIEELEQRLAELEVPA